MSCVPIVCVVVPVGSECAIVRGEAGEFGAAVEVVISILSGVSMAMASAESCGREVLRGR